MLSRIQEDYNSKYRVFKNVDLSYGRISDERFFSNIDDAADYIWSILVDYSNDKNDSYLNDIIVKARNIIDN